MNYTHTWQIGIPSDAAMVRTEVFVDEQGFPAEIELDELDKTALHIVLYQHSAPIATGRILQLSETEFRLGRIAVLQARRKSGIGAQIMQLMEQRAQELGAKKILLSAQLRTKEFYEKCGYTAVSNGKIYLDHHVEHINMEKSI